LKTASNFALVSSDTLLFGNYMSGAASQPFLLAKWMGLSLLLGFVVDVFADCLDYLEGLVYRIMDKLELVGRNLGRVFNSRRCSMYGMNLPCISYQYGLS
jgi:hypothetical protein